MARAGLVVLHNTRAKLGNGTSSPAGWQNTLLRNNVLIGTRYVFEEYGNTCQELIDRIMTEAEAIISDRLRSIAAA